MGLQENGVSPASERLDALIRAGRSPDPTNADELGAHLERVRRRVAEKHPPSSAAVPTTKTMTKRRGPADSAVVIVVLIVAALVLGGVILLGMEANRAQWAAQLASWASWR